jgi:hypothetical protein
MTILTTHPDVVAQRIKLHGEVMTPPDLVDTMLSQLPQSVWKKGQSFLDPACGDGNFLVAILLKKIKLKHPPLEALSTLFGADIQNDLIRECRLRLLHVIEKFEPITEDHIKIVLKNIIWINIKNHPLGSLEYNFDFDTEPIQSDIDKWLKYIHHQETTHPPVIEERFTSVGEIPDIYEEDSIETEEY